MMMGWRETSGRDDGLRHLGSSVLIAISGAALVFASLIALALLYASSNAEAAELEAVPGAYHTVAAQVGIPPSVLYAIALTESGTKLRSGRVMPWPWTLNVAGESRRFASREAAFADLSALLEAGRRNVDIGLAQVNWGWNGHRFEDAWSALDPFVNLEASALLLAELYATTGTWPGAAARYYGASDQNKRAAYQRRFERIWKRVAGL